MNDVTGDQSQAGISIQTAATAIDIGMDARGQSSVSGQLPLDCLARTRPRAGLGTFGLDCQTRDAGG
jgi:hypothetical protein